MIILHYFEGHLLFFFKYFLINLLFFSQEFIFFMIKIVSWTDRPDFKWFDEMQSTTEAALHKESCKSDSCSILQHRLLFLLHCYTNRLMVG